MAERLLLLEAAGSAANGLATRRKTLPNLYDTLFRAARPDVRLAPKTAATFLTHQGL
jgi:hypothetical protein